jgi:hypothetical protein
MLNGDR